MSGPLLHSSSSFLAPLLFTRNFGPTLLGSHSLQRSFYDMSVHPIRGRGQRGRARSRGGFRPHRGGAMNGPSRGMVSGATEPAIGSQDSTPMLSGRTTPLQNGPRFRDFPGLSEELLRTLPFEHCTEVSTSSRN